MQERHSAIALLARWGPSATFSRIIRAERVIALRECLSFLEADPGARDREGSSALDLACLIARDPEVLVALLDDARVRSGERNGRGVLPLHVATGVGNLVAVNALARHPRVSLFDRVCAAAYVGCCDLLGPFLDELAPELARWAARSDSPLAYAVLGVRPDALALLLSRGLFDPMRRDSSGFTLLHVLVHVDLAEEREADGGHDHRGDAAACVRSDVHRGAAAAQVVRLLVHSAGLGPSARDIGGSTALHYAASSEDGKAVEALVAGAGSALDLNPPEPQSWRTPLHVACAEGAPAAVRALLAAGAAPGAVSADGRTPLEVAAAIGRAEAVAEVLEGAGHAVSTASLTTALRCARDAGRQAE